MLAVFFQLLVPLTIALTLSHGAFTSVWGAEETSTFTESSEKCIQAWEQFSDWDTTCKDKPTGCIQFIKDFINDYGGSSDETCQKLAGLMDSYLSTARSKKGRVSSNLYRAHADLIRQGNEIIYPPKPDPAIQAELEALRKGKLEAEAKIMDLQEQLQYLKPQTTEHDSTPPLPSTTGKSQLPKTQEEGSLPACIQEWKEENFGHNPYRQFSQDFIKKHQESSHAICLHPVCQDLLKSIQEFQRAFSGAHPSSGQYKELYNSGRTIIQAWKARQAQHTVPPYNLSDALLQQLIYPQQWLKKNYQITFRLSISNNEELQQVDQILLKHGANLQNLANPNLKASPQTRVMFDQPLIRYLQLPHEIEDIDSDYIMAVLMTLQDTQQIFSKIKKHITHLHNDFGKAAFISLFPDNLPTLEKALTFEKSVEQRINDLIQQIDSITQGARISYPHITQEIVDVFPEIYRQTAHFVACYPTLISFGPLPSSPFPKIDIENYKSIFQDLFRMFAELSSQAHENITQVHKMPLPSPKQDPNYHFVLSQIQEFSQLQSDQPLNVSGTLERVQEMLDQWSHWHTLHHIQATEDPLFEQDTERLPPNLLKRVARNQKKIQAAQHNYKRFREALSGLATFTPERLLHHAQTLDKTPQNLDALLTYATLHTQHFSTVNAQDFAQEFSNTMLRLSPEERASYEVVFHDLHQTPHKLADDSWRELWPAYQEMLTSIKKLNLNGDGQTLKGFDPF